MSTGYWNVNTHSSYYNNSNNHGSYQYQSLDELINTFMAFYVGENKIIPKASREDVMFFGRRAIQELSYDTLRSKKTWEFEVDSRMYIPLPHDFVGYTNVFWVDSSGIKRPIYPIRETQNPFRPKVKGPSNKVNTIVEEEKRDENGNIVYTTVTVEDQDEWWETESVDASGNVTYTDVEGENPVTTSRFMNSQSNETEVHDYDYNDGYSGVALGQRYGLDPEHAQLNGSYYFDYENGRIYFGSSLINETIVIDYITDGLGEGGDMVIHKFAEEAFYKHVAYAIVSTGSNYSPATVQMLKKEKFATTRVAKIRLSNYKSKELTQVLRGKSKVIKK